MSTWWCPTLPAGAGSGYLPFPMRLARSRARLGVRGAVALHRPDRPWPEAADLRRGRRRLTCGCWTLSSRRSRCCGCARGVDDRGRAHGQGDGARGALRRDRARARGALADADVGETSRLLVTGKRRARSDLRLTRGRESMASLSRKGCRSSWTPTDQPGRATRFGFRVRPPITWAPSPPVREPHCSTRQSGSCRTNRRSRHATANGCSRGRRASSLPGNCVSGTCGCTMRFTKIPSASSWWWRWESRCEIACAFAGKEYEP